MKYQLIIDTSSKYLVVGLASENGMLKTTQYQAWQRQSEYAMLEIQKLLDVYEVNVKDINKIIVSKGPGSYTGIRIALTIAKTLAMVLKCDLIALSSLEMFIKPAGNYISILDARSKRVYAAVYEDSKCVLNECVLTLDELKELINKYPSYQLVGEVGVLGIEEKEENYALNMYELSKDKEGVKDVDALVPTYLKETYDY